ncbi:MAG: hypothetical protein KF850_30110 [Labilithrix sp.]|nr:hypothetical protein [Labilithrix sp.]
MGSSLPKFGRIDLDLDGEARAGSSAPPKYRRTPTFGEIDLGSIGEALEALDDAPEQSGSVEAGGAFSSRRPAQRREVEPQRRFQSSLPPPKETPTRQSLEAVRLAEEETRIAQAGQVADALSRSRDVIDADSATRVGRFEDPSPSSHRNPPSSRRNAPSASGVASRDDRVAAMRELYAQGNADAALALASEVALELDAALSDEVEVEVDPYGGLIPVDDDPIGLEPDEAGSEDHTAIAFASADSSRLAAMTSSRVPRLLVGPKEISTLPMDPRAAFILGHIDGIQSMEEILDVCAMPEAEALELIERLRALGVIALS